MTTVKCLCRLSFGRLVNLTATTMRTTRCCLHLSLWCVTSSDLHLPALLHCYTLWTASGRPNLRPNLLREPAASTADLVDFV